MKKIFFIIHTEYHMMVALTLIADFYSDENLYDIDIFQIERKGSTRFNFDKNTKLKSNVRYQVINYNKYKATFKDSNESFLEYILNSDYDIFIMFNHHIDLQVYIAKYLYKKGVEIHLAPDGAKVYAKSKFTPRWSFLMTLEYLKFIRSNKLPFNFYFPTLKYANLKEIKKIYIQFPDAYENASKKEIIKFNALKSEAAKELNLDFFNFSVPNELVKDEKVIMYINQPIRQDLILDFEIELLQKLNQKFHDYSLIIKFHPLTSKNQIVKFKSLDNVTLISKTFPAELYIASLNNSIVLSFWSTACLINNEKTRVYWLNKLLERKNMLFNNTKIINPTKHIKSIVAFEDIK